VLQGQWDHTDSVLRLSSKLQLEDGFAPKTWAQDNARDADLGSMSPVLLPNGLIFMAGKSGQGYLLHANALGGVNGQIQEATVCRSYGGAATANSQVFLPCVDGVRQLKVGPGETMTVGWHVAKNINGSPVVGGHTVYVLDYARGVLYALDSDQGTVRTSIPIGVTSRFATPTLSNGLVLVGTMKGVVAVKVA
jgi:outer membrane protein assembly factor BamB